MKILGLTDDVSRIVDGDEVLGYVMPHADGYEVMSFGRRRFGCEEHNRVYRSMEDVLSAVTAVDDSHREEWAGRVFSLMERVGATTGDMTDVRVTHMDSSFSFSAPFGAIEKINSFDGYSAEENQSPF